MTEQFEKFMDFLTTEIVEKRVYTNSFATSVIAMADNFVNGYEVRRVVRERVKEDGSSDDLAVFNQEGDEVRPCGKEYLKAITVLQGAGLPREMTVVGAASLSEKAWRTLKHQGFNNEEIANMMAIDAMGIVDSNLNRWQEAGVGVSNDYFQVWCKALDLLDHDRDSDFQGLLLAKLERAGVSGVERISLE